jgi:hypothetical protein
MKYQDSIETPIYIAKNSQEKLCYSKIKVIDCRHNLPSHDFPSYEQAAIPSSLRARVIKSIKIQPKKIQICSGRDGTDIQQISKSICCQKICCFDILATNGCENYNQSSGSNSSDDCLCANNDSEESYACCFGLIIASSLVYLAIKIIQWSAAGVTYLVGSCMNCIDHNRADKHLPVSKIQFKYAITLPEDKESDGENITITIIKNPLNPLYAKSDQNDLSSLDLGKGYDIKYVGNVTYINPNYLPDLINTLLFMFFFMFLSVASFLVCFMCA